MSYAEPLLSALTQFSWGEEDVDYKTRPTNINQYLRLHSTPELPVPVPETETIHAPGHGRGPAYVLDELKRELKGTIPFEVVTAEFFGAIFGECVTTGSGPDYTHTYNLSTLMPKSFATQAVFLQGATPLIQEYLGCRVNAATLKVAEDAERLLCDVDYFAAKPQDGGSTAETVATTRDRPFLFKEGAFSSTSIYTGAKARVFDFELPINLNCKPVYAGGQGNDPYDIVPGKADYGEMKVTVGIEDDTEWDEILGVSGTRHDFSYLFDRGTNDTLTISGNGKYKGPKYAFDDHDVRADLILVPDDITAVLVNTTELWAFEAA